MSFLGWMTFSQTEKLRPWSQLMGLRMQVSPWVWYWPSVTQEVPSSSSAALNPKGPLVGVGSHVSRPSFEIWGDNYYACFFFGRG